MDKTTDCFVLDPLTETNDSTQRARPAAVAAFEREVTQYEKDLFADAILQVQKYNNKWADDRSIVRDFEGLLRRLDSIVEASPPFYKFNKHGVAIFTGIALPISFMFNLLSNTAAGYTLFTDKGFNRKLKKLLNSWGEWLTRPESRYTLEEWFSEEGLHSLQSGLGQYTFDDTYKLDPYAPDEAKTLRYKSWDSFFTRQFKDVQALRPIVSSLHPDVSFLYSACESAVYRTAENVQVHDTFWLKTQNYSLYDILGDLREPYAHLLEGASAYQGALGPTDYHRWHSPIKGQVLAHCLIDGTYFATLPDEGAPAYNPDLAPGDPHCAIARSQGWLTASATRAVLILQPTDPTSPIELAAFVAVGMVEVSTCEITYHTRDVPHPEHVQVGDELGMFHFGGSSYTLFVKTKPTHRLVFQDNFNTPVRPGQRRWLNAVIGQFWPVV